MNRNVKFQYNSYASISNVVMKYAIAKDISYAVIQNMDYAVINVNLYAGIYTLIKNN